MYSTYKLCKNSRVLSSEATLQLFMSAQLSVYPSVRMSVCLLGLGGNVIFSAPY